MKRFVVDHERGGLNTRRFRSLDKACRHAATESLPYRALTFFVYDALTLKHVVRYRGGIEVE